MKQKYKETSGEKNIEPQKSQEDTRKQKIPTTHDARKKCTNKT